MFQLIHTLDMRDLVAPDSDYAVNVASYVEICGSIILNEQRPFNYLIDSEKEELDDLHEWFNDNVDYAFHVTQDSMILCVAIDDGLATLDPYTFEIVCNYDLFEGAWGGTRYQSDCPYDNELLFKSK
jgi:hypothetical protein